MEKKDMVKFAEKVKFWEEQDRINKELIPRVLKNHELIVEVSSKLNKQSNEIIKLESKVKQLNGEEFEEALQKELNILRSSIDNISKSVKELENDNIKIKKNNKISIAISCLALLLSLVGIFI